MSEKTQLRAEGEGSSRPLCSARDHALVRRKALLALPKHQEMVNYQKISDALRSRNGRIEMREAVRDYIKDLQIILDRI